MRLPTHLVDRVRRQHPVPIADAVAGLDAAENLHEARDRIVEVFRACLRMVGTCALAARRQFGPGPGASAPQVPELLRTLRRRGLTDGQWLALTRELLRPWRTTPLAHVLPTLVDLFFRNRRFVDVLDGLLKMRKDETIAHGAAGNRAALEAILERRVVDLQALLEALDPLWERARLALPLAVPDDTATPQTAWVLTGETPPRGRWRRMPLSARVAPGAGVLIDADGQPLLALHPLLLVRRPSPEAIEEVFVLEGGPSGARYVALPSMAGHVEDDVWRSLEELVDAEATLSVRTDARPYRGLTPFGVEHRDSFFGRDLEAQGYANRLRRHAFLTLTGPSGSGKTSLVHAGILPRLDDHAHLSIRPGTHPHRTLLTALSRTTQEATLAEARAAPDRTGELLADAQRATGRPLLIVVDQAEELCTLCTDAEERDAFGRAIASLGSVPELPFRVLLSVREDFFGRLATVPRLHEVYARQVGVVTTPGRDALIQAMTGPLVAYDHAFETLDLVQAMVDAVATTPSALALLQFCADQMWEARDRTWRRLTWASYRSLGGIEGALSHHAERVHDDLTPSLQSELQRVLLRLVTSEDTRAVCTRAELLEVADDATAAGALVDHLVAARLLVAREDEGGRGTVVELVHEALILHWTRLATWLADDREGRRTLLAIRNAAREWVSRGRPRGLLWRDEMLEGYRVWRRQSTSRLTVDEEAFASASLLEERRAARQKRALTAGAVTALLVFAGFMTWQWGVAQAEGLRALSGQLRAMAVLHEREGRPEEGAALWRASVEVDARSAAGTADPTARYALVQRWPSNLTRVFDVGVSPTLAHPAANGPAHLLANAADDGDVALWNLRDGSLQATLEGSPAGLTALAFSPDGATLAAGFADGDLRLWDVVSGALRARRREHAGAIHGLAFAPDGGELASIDLDGLTVRTWDIRTGDNTRTLRPPPDLADPAQGAGFTTVAFLTPAAAAGGGHLATGLRDGRVLLWTGQDRGWQASSDPAAGVPVTALTASPDGTFVVSSTERSVRTYTADGTLLRTLDEGSDAARFSPDGRLLATDTGMWRFETGERLTTFQGRFGGFSTDGTYACSAEGQHLTVWHTPSAQRVLEVVRPTDDLALMGFVDDDLLSVAGSSADPTARMWSLRDPTRVAIVPMPGQVQALAFAADNDTLAVADEQEVRLWRTRTAEPLGAPLSSKAPIRGLAIDRTGARVAVGTGFSGPASSQQPARVEVWDARDARNLGTFEGRPESGTTHPGVDGALRTLAFSRDANRVMGAILGDRVRLWNLRAATLERDFTDAGWEAAWGPVEGTVVMGRLDGHIAIVDATTGATRLRVPGVHFAVSGDGTRLATAGDPTTLRGASNASPVRIWSLPDGALLGEANATTGPTTAMAFSPRADVLATGHADGSLTIWESATLRERTTTRAHRSTLSWLQFTADGSLLATAALSLDADPVRVWDVASGLQATELPGGHTRKDGAPARIRAVTLHPSQSLLASGGGDSATVRDLAPYRAAARGLLDATGALTNLRTCRGSLRIVPIVPFPHAGTVWVDEERDAAEAARLCGEAH